MSEESHAGRLDRVEAEVTTIRSEMGGLRDDLGGVKADVRGLGAILGRIEQGVLRAQEQQEHREQASRPNLVAMVSVLVTVISILVGGAWMIGGKLERMDERSVWMQRIMWDKRG